MAIDVARRARTIKPDPLAHEIFFHSPYHSFLTIKVLSKSCCVRIVLWFEHQGRPQGPLDHVSTPVVFLQAFHRSHIFLLQLSVSYLRKGMVDGDLRNLRCNNCFSVTFTTEAIAHTPSAGSAAAGVLQLKGNGRGGRLRTPSQAGSSDRAAEQAEHGPPTPTSKNSGSTNRVNALASNHSLDTRATQLCDARMYAAASHKGRMTQQRSNAKQKKKSDW